MVQNISQKNLRHQPILLTMISLLGKDPYKPLMETALSELEIASLGPAIPATASAGVPLQDNDLVQPGSLWQESDPVLLRLVTDRAALRSHCRQAGLAVPDGIEADSMEALARWAITHNRFPLALKSCWNQSNGRGTYRLEGFRELSGFFDKIHEIDPGPMRLEDWIDAKAQIEITMGPASFQLTAQVGLERNLTGRTEWRLFPVSLPALYRPQVEAILGAFAKFMPTGKRLLRFTIALTERQALLLSLNAGFNRLEYYPGWLGANPVATPMGILSGQEVPPLPASGKEKFRLQFFRKAPKDGPWPDALPGTTSSLPIVRYAGIGKFAAALMAGEDVAALDRAARTLKTLLRAASGGTE